ARSDEPWHFYFHTWELDPDQPRITAGTRFDRIRQYRNLELMQERIEARLDAHAFTGIASHLELAREPAPERAKSAVPVVVAAKAQHTGPRQKVTIVTPCYNEEETLPYLASTLA